MATERALALAAIVAAVSCSPVSDRCQAGTLLVQVTLSGATAGADQLTVDVALDGGAPHESTLVHTPGHAAGNVLVQFPSGYPRGHRVDVTLSSSANGVVLGSATATATLSDSCAVATLTVTEGGGDLGAGDDGGAVDLASADLRAHDLATGPDLWTGCVPTGVENCFNGIDDDCNGHIDCDDGACAPIAVCVPAATTPFGYITEEPPAGSCSPGSTNGGTLYDSSNPGGGGCNAGSCGCNTLGCTTTPLLDNGCPSGSGTPNGYPPINDVCSNALNGMNNLFIPTPTGTLSCMTTGSTTPVTPPTLTKKLACTANAVGGGCTSGQVCAPLGTQQCVLAAGSHACPSGYPSGMTWYTSITDNRSCSCSCTPSSCASARPRGYMQSSCTGAGTAPPGPEICSNDFMYWKLGGPSCASSSSLGGTSIQFNGASTVCCE